MLIKCIFKRRARDKLLMQRVKSMFFYDVNRHYKVTAICVTANAALLVQAAYPIYDIFV